MDLLTFKTRPSSLPIFGTVNVMCLLRPGRRAGLPLSHKPELRKAISCSRLRHALDFALAATPCAPVLQSEPGKL